MSPARAAPERRARRPRTHLERWPIDRKTGRAIYPSTPPLGRERVNAHQAADPREVLPAIAAQRGETLAALSRMIGRSEGYLARFVREGVPVALTLDDHRFLADHFGVSERGLGIRDLWADRGRGW